MIAETPLRLLLNSREAARSLAISERSLWTLTQEGQIPVIRIGKRTVRYAVDDLLAWIGQSRQSAPNGAIDEQDACCRSELDTKPTQEPASSDNA